MRRKLKLLSDSVQQARKCPFYGFVEGHESLTSADVTHLDYLINNPSHEVVEKYESSIASLIGRGDFVSFAAARMGFFELMRILGVGPDHEVILLGYTCAVMANAVIRLGATPVYSDIDHRTFGSSVDSIAACINSRTKIVVAQHSFGIPCGIVEIKELLSAKNIFLIEDCALAFGSSLHAKTIGQYGDAAIFSTDHAKPINTIIGGGVYTENKELYRTLKMRQTGYRQLGTGKQKALLRQLKVEKRLCNPESFRYEKIVSILNLLLDRVSGRSAPFLSDDTGTEEANTYPYPAPMPSFLCYLGCLEVRRWSDTRKHRQEALNKFLSMMKEKKLDHLLPDAYYDPAREVIPHRLVWAQPNNQKTLESLAKFVDISGIWFREPIVCATVPLSLLGYSHGSCPDAESICDQIINVPIPAKPHDINHLFKILNEIIKSRNFHFHSE